MVAAAAFAGLVTDLSRLGLSTATADALALHAQQGGMPLDGARARASQVLFGITEGIITGYEAATLLKEQPEYLRLDMRLAHEDDHLACVDKPCDIRLSVPRGGVAWTGEEGAPGGPWAGPSSGLPCPEVTVHEWLKEHVPQVVTPGGEVRLCHQLDYSTSGLIVGAKSTAAARAVCADFERRDARKLYLALVFGAPEWEQRAVSAPIVVSSKKFKQRVGKGGKSARTHAEVACRGRLVLPPHAGRLATLMWLTPHTGRRHQLRLHMQHVGHPIVGDYTYAADKLAYRMFLHAA